MGFQLLSRWMPACAGMTVAQSLFFKAIIGTTIHKLLKCIMLLEKKLSSITAFSPIIPANLQHGRVILANFSNVFWKNMCLTAKENKDCWPEIQNHLNQHAADIAIGPYLEKRQDIYYKNNKKDDYIHLGIDLIVAPETPVFSAYNGKVIRIEHSTQQGDYGTMILIEHVIDQIIFYTLYGHLNPKITEDIDSFVTAGQHIGFVADEKNNGQWPPHLHFQILDAEIGLTTCWGAVITSEAKKILPHCPNPNLILQIEALMKTLTLADICSDVDSARIKRWCVAEGESIQKGDMLVEFESMKVHLSITAPFSGKLIKQIAQIGDSIDLEKPVLIVDDYSV